MTCRRVGSKGGGVLPLLQLRSFAPRRWMIVTCGSPVVSADSGSRVLQSAEVARLGGRFDSAGWWSSGGWTMNSRQAQAFGSQRRAGCVARDGIEGLGGGGVVPDQRVGRRSARGATVAQV